MHSKLKCPFWNARGIDAPGRKSLIIDILNRTSPVLVGFQETKKEVISDSFLKSLVSNRDFSWGSALATGSTGGILVGFDNSVFDLVAWDIREFSISATLIYKPKQFKIRIITVYGSPYEEGKESFISELHGLFIDDQTPTLIGGDFNLVRYKKDKTNGKVNLKWCDKFNA